MADNNDNNILSWTSDEYKSHDRSVGWFVGLFLLGLILIVWGLYSNNIISTLLFLIIVFIVYGLSQRKPERVRVELSDRGVKLNEVFYPFNTIKHFWILEHDDGELELTFETESFLNKHVSVQLENIDVGVVRVHLRNHLEEIEDYEENFIDFVVRKLRL